MRDRPSSSYDSSQEDRSLGRSSQDSPCGSARWQHVDQWSLMRNEQQHGQTDNQTSMPRGMDKGKQEVDDPKSSQRNDMHGEAEKRLKVILREYGFYLKECEIGEKGIKLFSRLCKREFNRAINESKREKYIEYLANYLRKVQPDKYDSEEQIEIDKKLGHLLKSSAELREARMGVLRFMEEKINNASSQDDIKRWALAISEYYDNHDQLVRIGLRHDSGIDISYIHNSKQLKIMRNSIKDLKNSKGELEELKRSQQSLIQFADTIADTSPSVKNLVNGNIQENEQKIQEKEQEIEYKEKTILAYRGDNAQVFETLERLDDLKDKKKKEWR